MPGGGGGIMRGEKKCDRRDREKSGFMELLAHFTTRTNSKFMKVPVGRVNQSKKTSSLTSRD
jgi:hypothetical protein